MASGSPFTQIPLHLAFSALISQSPRLLQLCSKCPGSNFHTASLEGFSWQGSSARVKFLPGTKHKAILLRSPCLNSLNLPLSLPRGPRNWTLGHSSEPGDLVESVLFLHYLGALGAHTQSPVIYEDCRYHTG